MFKLAVLVVVALVVQVNSHGRLMRPVNRSSVWRVAEFASFDPPANWNDNELYCGAAHQPDIPGNNCGVCGDALSIPTPRPNEVGGQFYRGIITGRYSSGDIIDIEVELTQSHLGFMEFRLCANPGAGETQACFNEHLLQRVDGQGSRVPVDRGTGWYNYSFRLPGGVTCSRCTLQWNYRAGNNWGTCPDGSGAMGCGPQETFRGCSDIAIA